MKKIKEYLKNKNRKFQDGVDLYNEFGENIVPDFQKYSAFFKKVDKENEAFSKGLLETRLNYILRLSAQNEELAKKKGSAPKAIKTDIEENSEKDTDKKDPKKGE